MKGERVAAASALAALAPESFPDSTSKLLLENPKIPLPPTSRIVTISPEAPHPPVSIVPREVEGSSLLKAKQPSPQQPPLLFPPVDDGKNGAESFTPPLPPPTSSPYPPLPLSSPSTPKEKEEYHTALDKTDLQYLISGLQRLEAQTQTAKASNPFFPSVSTFSPPGYTANPIANVWGGGFGDPVTRWKGVIRDAIVDGHFISSDHPMAFPGVLDQTGRGNGRRCIGKC
ncbi:hypothetical protein AAES_17571 [Amazona aestiva]|uniref:Uncharacterized protein n=1 Tax=Amazona aestiva TaxID=12930 RepID=A0A0Q3X890_AMAAE|nr:hypothetical protein AAES_17571 [Amazona aestiva]